MFPPWFGPPSGGGAPDLTVEAPIARLTTRHSGIFLVWKVRQGAALPRLNQNARFPMPRTLSTLQASSFSWDVGLVLPKLPVLAASNSQTDRHITTST
jgi:hypothetical protein